MRFSVIVPIYNVEQYLHKCVDSLINQTLSDIEIILVDDGSPDNSPAICDEYALKDSRIKVIHKVNGGLSDARNKGILAAEGDYLIFVDADDYIELDTCERLLPYADRGVDIIIADAIVEGGECNFSHIDASDEMTGEEYLLRAFRARRAPMAAVLNICRRQFLIDNDLLFKYGILHEDEQFTPRAFLKAKSVICTGERFYHYIIRENSIMTKKDQRKNATDLYGTCCELEKIYLEIENTELRNYLLNSLANRTLSVFQKGRLYQYGKEYIYKDLVKRTARIGKTRYKAALYRLSPRIYYLVNRVFKKFI